MPIKRLIVVTQLLLCAPAHRSGVDQDSDTIQTTWQPAAVELAEKMSPDEVRKSTKVIVKNGTLSQN